MIQGFIWRTAFWPSEKLEAMRGFNDDAAAFDDPDHITIVHTDYRWRLRLTDGKTKIADLENRLAAFPVVTVPTVAP